MAALAVRESSLTRTSPCLTSAPSLASISQDNAGRLGGEIGGVDRAYPADGLAQVGQRAGHCHRRRDLERRLTAAEASPAGTAAALRTATAATGRTSAAVGGRRRACTAGSCTVPAGSAATSRCGLGAGARAARGRLASGGLRLTRAGAGRGRRGGGRCIGHRGLGMADVGGDGIAPAVCREPNHDHRKRCQPPHPSHAVSSFLIRRADKPAPSSNPCSNRYVAGHSRRD